MSDREHRIAAAVDAWAAMHRDELIRDIGELIRIRSVVEYGESGFPMGSGCKQAADKLIELGERYGFQTENDAYYCVSILSPGTAGEMGILGHLDVVSEGKGWRFPPFEPTLQNGSLVGRGASDCKGPLVMGLYVLRCMRDLQLPLKSSLRLIAGCDEETSMTDVLHYQQTHSLPDFTLNCDGAWAVGIGEKGILNAEIVIPLCGGNLKNIQGGTAPNAVPDEACAVLASLDETEREKIAALCPEAVVMSSSIFIKGMSAHASTPERGENAILKLLSLLCDTQLPDAKTVQKIQLILQSFPDAFGAGLRIQHEDKHSRTTCIPTQIHMEENSLVLHINVRSAVTQNEKMLLSSLKKRCAKLGMTVRNASFSPPRLTSTEAPEVKILLETCREFLHASSKPYVAGGGTHSRVFPRSIPFGPLASDPRIKRPFGGPHASHEAVFVDDLLQGIRVYVMALLRLDAYFHPDNP